MPAEQAQPDGDFPTVKSPNPEERVALEPAISIAQLHHGDILLANDPDCDRLGIVVRDDEVDKLYFLLVRVLRIAIQNPVLSSELKVSPLDCMDYRLVACFIESIADSVASMADSLLRHVDSPKIYLERFRSLLTILSEIYEKAMEAFLAKDFKRAELARARREVFDSRLSSEDLGDIGFLSSELVKIADIAVDIADLVIP